MRSEHFHRGARVVLAVATFLLILGNSGFAQTTVNLTAQRMSTTLPDGKTVPMWGYCTTGACSAQWAPGPTITVAPGTSLTINLTNNLPAPTSIVILGQFGGGLGTPAKVSSPAHPAKTMTTWPTNSAATFTPPAQGPRAQSFGLETAGSGGTQTYTWSSLNPGTYIYETGTQPSIQAPMGLYGVLVVTNAPIAADPNAGTSASAGTAHPGAYSWSPALKDVPYDSDAILLVSEIDARQNASVDAIAAGLCPASSAPVCSGTIDPGAYPPAVNYAPTYFLLNGQSFDKTAPTAIALQGAALSGNVLLRFANAGSKTHIPTVVGLSLSLIAEDGNVAPGNPKVQSEVLLTAGKTFDVLVQPSHTGAAYDSATFRVFDRQLSLSADNHPDGGIQGFLQIAGGTLPASINAAAVDDPYTVPVNSATFSGNVLDNDIGIRTATLGTAPTHGTVVLNPDGTFTYTPTSGSVGVDTFTYYGNGNTALTATVTFNIAAVGAAPIAQDDAYTSNLATRLKVPAPGVLANDTDPSGYPLTAKPDPGNPLPSWVSLNSDGSFTVTLPPQGAASFTYLAVNSQGTASAAAKVSLTFPQRSGLAVTLLDAVSKASLPADYRWVIEEDTTFHNGLTPTTGTPQNPVPANTLGVNFHRSYMPIVASGCMGSISCGDGQTANGVAVPPESPTDPGDVVLDPTKYYYISILPGSAADPATGAGSGHALGGATISPGQTAATVLSEQTPLQPAQLSIFVFEDNNPTNGDVDGPEESQGLGGFQIIINDPAGRTGDPAGQITYDAFNMPLTNALIGTPGCPTPSGSQAGAVLQGMIVTCPNDPVTGPGHPTAAYALAGHALVKNIMPGRFDVFANPGAAREGAGEQWIQVSTLEGTHANDAFAGVNEPAYFQEFGPPGLHSFIGFVNPAHIKQVNAALHGSHSVKGKVTNLHMSRPSNETLYDSGSHVPLSQSRCYVGLNAQNGTGADVAFAVCDDNGQFTLTGVPDGTYQVAVWDEWLDQIIEYASVTVQGADKDMGDVPVQSWFTRVETRMFMDDADLGNPGISQVPVTIRYRDGSISNRLFTDSDGYATFNELFPLFNWYVIESDTTRFKGTKVDIAVDGGGPVDTTGDFAGILSSHYPTGESSVRTDPGTTLTEGIQSFISETLSLKWGKTNYKEGETGGITGMAIYASTRGFDDPRQEVQFNWEPGVPRASVRLYQVVTAPDGTEGLKYLEETKTSSWDDNLPTNCPGQVTTDPFYLYTLGADPANQYKCYDGFHNWNQVRPAVYDGRYYFTTMPDGTTPLPVGKYVVEMVPPPGYEIVKEEDKNILIGDAWIAPVAQQFGGLSNIFILPDQATVNATPGSGPASSFPPCVGENHRVPDYLSMFPQVGQVAPFAGADRPLCNRKEVTLSDQMQANADFHLFTSVPVASHYTGMILNDASSEFNTASPDFGEKFAVPFVPVSIRDFNGVEISRTYSDQWGMFNGLTPSTWEPNVPNPSGYSPNMVTTCMNDPGPILDPATGKMITDPAYNPMFSNFCYTMPFMPGMTDYLDTPVLPVAAYASGYNPVDCAYPDATPAISRVDSNTGWGPYLTSAGGTLTIKALGDAVVPNPAYQGPTATTAPFNQKTIKRHYGFGAQRGPGTVKIGNVNLAVTSWSDDTIQVTVPPNTPSGELLITAGNGKASVDTVTVTIENRVPKRVQASAGQTIQAAIDSANPGDLILVDAGTYNELVIMWKPVRLQGVGAASVIINAAKYPATKLQAWRPRINQLFGIDAQGNQTLPAQVDPLPGQEITGGVVLLEPSVLATEEGAGITVLAKNLPDIGRRHQCAGQFGASNFLCGDSRIDGLSVTGGDSGGGIYVNGWAHNLEISNNRVYGNAGAMNGGVRVGVPYLEGLAGAGPFDFNDNIKIHHNAITTNGTVEANAGESGAGGGLSICSGTDNYTVNYNFICGNFSMSDGGGIGHIGLSWNGNISNNSILFNQSFNQSATTNGGGLVIEGETAAGAGLSLGTGNVVVDSNLILGNHAQAGHGGGVRLQDVNGADVARRPNNPGSINAPAASWWQVVLTNNIIVNNVAGYAGGGISLENTAFSSIVNNTVASNDSTATVGNVFTTSPTTSNYQPAGISSELHSPALVAVFGNGVQVTSLKVFSNPTLRNNIIWQNRSFYFTIDGNGNSSLIPTLTQSTTGECPSGANYWDLGLVGDRSQNPGANRLNPTYSLLTPNTFGLYNSAAQHNLGPATAGLTQQYCNGARSVPGIPDGTPTAPQPPFTMQVAGTVDEGGNWIDTRFGPLSLSSLVADASGNHPAIGNYHILLNSPAVDVASNNAPNHDFDGQNRPLGAGYDIGADEVAAPAAPKAGVSPGSLSFGNQALNTTSNAQAVTLSNTGTAQLTGILVTTSANFARAVNGGSCGTTLNAGATCTINVVFQPTAAGAVSGTLTVSSNDPVNPSLTVALSGAGVVAAPQGTLTPATWNFGTVTRGAGVLQQPVHLFTLTNSGNAPLTNIAVSIGGPSTDYSVVPLATTCGNGAGQLIRLTTLNPGQTCAVAVRFAPKTADPANSVQTGTLSVTDNAVSSPQTSQLTGTAR